MKIETYKLLEKRIERLENKLIKENLVVSTFDCDRLGLQIEDLLEDIYGIVDISDDNADNGFINVYIEHEDMSAEYDIIVSDFNSMTIFFNNKIMAKAPSLDDCAKKIASHFRKLVA